MASHNHNHKCTCEHESVKFCKHCNTVYCTGCNQEWTTKVNWTYQYNNPLQPYTYSTGYLQNINSKDLGQQIPMDNQGLLNTLDDGHTLTVGSTCGHKA